MFKQATIRKLALVNCVIALAALILRDVIDDHVFQTVCKWLLIIAWIVQGIYLFYKPKAN